MSVVLITRFKVGDMERAKQALASNEGMLQEITQAAKTAGSHHHRFLEQDGELVSLDEWESAESFQQFFQSNQMIPKIMEDVGVQGEPKTEVLQPVESPDAF
jgi:quinol monooxygenase YgiN